MSPYREAAERAIAQSGAKIAPLPRPWWVSYAVHLAVLFVGLYAELWRNNQHVADWTQVANIAALVAGAAILIARLVAKVDS